MKRNVLRKLIILTIGLIIGCSAYAMELRKYNDYDSKVFSAYYLKHATTTFDENNTVTNTAREAISSIIGSDWDLFEYYKINEYGIPERNAYFVASSEYVECLEYEYEECNKCHTVSFEDGTEFEIWLPKEIKLKGLYLITDGKYAGRFVDFE